MLKHLMNGGSLLSYAVYDAESEAKAAKDAQRALLVKNNTVGGTPPAAETPAAEGEVGEEEEEENEEEEEPEPEPAEGDENLTEEEKAAKALEEEEKQKAAKIAAKAQRKQDRMQRRIDEAVAATKAAKEELERFKTSNPDSKLTEDEVEARAEAKAAEKLAAKELEKLQTDFQKLCDDLQTKATKIDKDFDDKVADIADQFGRLPSFMLSAMADMDNGPELLVYLVNNDEFAEEMYKATPAKMTRKLVELSMKLTEEEKGKKKRQISRVPEPITPVAGGRAVSNTITSADTKPENMDNFVRKRQAQIEERRKMGR